MRSDERALRLLVAGIAWPPETFIRRLLVGLVDAGVEVTVGSARSPHRGPDAEPRVRWRPMPTWDAPMPLRVTRLAAMAARAALAGRSDLRTMAAAAPRGTTPRDRLRRWNMWLPFAGGRWDLIYFPWNSAAVAYLPAFDLGMPVIVSCRGAQVSIAPHNPRRAEINQGLGRSVAAASAVHCVSDAIAAEAVALGADPARVRVIRPAIDPSVFAPGGARDPGDGAFRVISTGSVIWRKGYEFALVAIARLRDAGVPVLYEIIGDGPERQRVVYTTRDLGLEGSVTLAGKLPPEEVVRRLQQADAFLLASVSEGISNAVLEAMGCGLPVVTTECGGMREAVDDGVEGLVTPVRDADAMAVALQRLASDPALRERMGAAARARILRQFTLQRQIDAWLELLRQAIEQQPRRGKGTHVRDR